MAKSASQMQEHMTQWSEQHATGSGLLHSFVTAHEQVVVPGQRPDHTALQGGEDFSGGMPAQREPPPPALEPNRGDDTLSLAVFASLQALRKLVAQSTSARGSGSVAQLPARIPWSGKGGQGINSSDADRNVLLSHVVISGRHIRGHDAAKRTSMAV